MNCMWQEKKSDELVSIVDFITELFMYNNSVKWKSLMQTTDIIISST
jgi:hypothetical protein